MREIIKSTLCLLLSIISFSIAQNVSAQGSNPGRVTPPNTPAPKKPTKTTPKTKPTPKPSVKIVTPKVTSKPKVAKKPTVKTPGKIQYGSLQISVNEPDSEVFVSDASGNVLEENSIIVEDNSTPLEINDLQTGSYTIKVRKSGYFETEQKVFISANKTTSVSLLLKPSAAFLSVSTNVDGATIEIENVSEFENKVENLLLQPGNYRVNVYKTGYVIETRQVSLSSAGQKNQISVTLKPLSMSELLADAQKNFDAKDCQKAIRSARQILSVEPNHQKANAIAGYCFFNDAKPTDSTFLLSRAIGAGEEIGLPVRIYNKEKGNLQLPLGKLTYSRGLLWFVGLTVTNFNFTISRSDVSELIERTDEFGIAYISLKAKGVFNGKNDKRTVRLYSEQTFVRPSKKELGCTNCSPTVCLCRNVEKTLYDLLNRWRIGDFTTQKAGFSAVMLPSANFDRYTNANFSLKIPENWQALVKNDTQVLFAPIGGFEQTQSQIQYSHGINAFVAPNPDNLTVNQAAENFITNIIKANPYLKQGETSVLKLSIGQVLVNKLSGFSAISQREESVTIYLTLTPKGSVFVMNTVVPPDEQIDYDSTFRRILNSISF